jgi:hypothetical protein
MVWILLLTPFGLHTARHQHQRRPFLDATKLNRLREEVRNLALTREELVASGGKVVRIIKINDEKSASPTASYEG